MYSYSTLSNDQNTLPHPILIPIQTPSSPQTLTPIPVHLPDSYLATSAVKIQSAYRGHLVRSFVRTIRAVDSDARRIQRMIQRQETVDAVRDEGSVERIRLSEMLMRALLRLDSVPGFYPAVRELRRNLSRRIVALQELLDAIATSDLSETESRLDGIPASLEEIFTKACKGDRRKWSCCFDMYL